MDTPVSSETGRRRRRQSRRDRSRARAGRRRRASPPRPLPAPRQIDRAGSSAAPRRSTHAKRWRGCEPDRRPRGAGGEPGSARPPGGATRRQVHAEGHVVLYGRADEESVSPYSRSSRRMRHYAAHRPPAREETRLAAAAARELARLVPELGMSARRRSIASRRQFDALAARAPGRVRRLLLHPARTQRLLLVLEDLHWADAPTCCCCASSCAAAPACRCCRRDLPRPGGGRVRPAGAPCWPTCGARSRGHDPPGRLRPLRDRRD
jgi:hypothetical protein